MTPPTLVLILASDGCVRLEEEGDIVWSSDDDEDFLTAIEGEDFLTEDDIPAVLDYLEDEEIITAEERATLEFEVEALEAEEADGDPDEPGELAP